MNEVYFITPDRVINSNSVAIIQLEETFKSIEDGDEVVRVYFIFIDGNRNDPVYSYVKYEDFKKMLTDWESGQVKFFNIFKPLQNGYHEKSEVIKFLQRKNQEAKQ